MRLSASLFKLLCSILALSLSTSAIASDVPSKDNISAIDFVNQALITSVAQIETAKLALQQSSTTEIKEFAQLVIDERTTAKNDLTAIAKKKKLRVVSEKDLPGKAQPYILKFASGAFSDEAYVNSQIKARQDELSLFNQGALNNDPEVAGFATENIPKLTHNLHLAETLATELGKK